MTGFATHGIPKRLLDSRLAWDILGPLYNRRISILLTEVYWEIAEEIQTEENARILDVGCGPGFFTVMLAQRYPATEVTGIDYSSTEIRAAKKSVARTGVGNCRFMQANAMDLPFEDECFDQVVSTFSIKHWPDRTLGMAEINRVLVPGGGAFITEYNRDYTDEEYERFYERVEEVLGKYLSALPTTPGGVRWVVKQGLSPREVVDVARGAGFGEVRAGRIEGWPYLKLVLGKKAI